MIPIAFDGFLAFKHSVYYIILKRTGIKPVLGRNFEVNNVTIK